MTETASTTPSEMFVVDTPYEIARWRPLVNWILYIPHGIILYGLRILAASSASSTGSHYCSQAD